MKIGNTKEVSKEVEKLLQEAILQRNERLHDVIDKTKRQDDLLKKILTVQRNSVRE
jgi:hypothetical protein